MTCKHTEGTYHDCAYVDARNALHPAAEEYANRLAGLPPPGSNDRRDEWVAQWNQAFHGFVDRAMKASPRRMAS